MTPLLNKCYSGCHKATEEEDDRKTLGKRSGEGNVDSRLQVQLEEDGSGSTKQSGVETNDLCFDLCSSRSDEKA